MRFYLTLAINQKLSFVKSTAISSLLSKNSKTLFVEISCPAFKADVRVHHVPSVRRSLLGLKWNGASGNCWTRCLICVASAAVRFRKAISTCTNPTVQNVLAAATLLAANSFLASRSMLSATLLMFTAKLFGRITRMQLLQVGNISYAMLNFEIYT